MISKPYVQPPVVGNGQKHAIVNNNEQMQKLAKFIIDDNGHMGVEVF